MGRIIDGKLIANGFKEDIKHFINKRNSDGLRNPCMAAIIVGNDGGSEFYFNSQIKLCRELQIDRKNIYLSENITEAALIEEINKLNKDKSIDGIILQLPLPKHFDERNITSQISSRKDIDGLTDINIGRLYKGEKSIIPCTPKGIMELLTVVCPDLKGKEAVVLGRSNIVGKPVAQLLLNQDATVTICHSKTLNLKGVCKRADILVSAIGRPGFVTKEYVKAGAIVIDVGTTYVQGKIMGDVDFEEVLEQAAFLTPVPGGVGAMTTVMLMKNLCEAIE